MVFISVSGVLAVFFLSLHPIVHNLVLLFLMPTYRRVIANGIARIRAQKELRRIPCLFEEKWRKPAKFQSPSHRIQSVGLGRS